MISIVLFRWTGVVGLALGVTCAISAAGVTLQDAATQVTLSNGIVRFVVYKATATIPEITLRGSDNLAARGAYFAVANSGGRDGGDIHNADFKVVRNTPELAELSCAAPVGGVRFDIHYVLREGDPGFYVFVLQQRRAGDPPEHTGQVRWSCYLNPKLFDYQLASDREQGPIPDLTGAPPVQDATFRLHDGTIYTKYNYCTYLEEDDVHGLCGTGHGAFGAFVVRGSAEYLQAPTKQEITVHAPPIIHCIVQSGHFQPRELADQPIPDGWTKLCGPWFVYFNSGDSPQDIWADAKARAQKERLAWPYPWMQHPEYPLARGQVSGTLRVGSARAPAANALVLLTAPEPDWQLQILHYLFSTRADAEGRFVLPHVRAGSYTLFASIPGLTDEFRQDGIRVTADGEADLGTLTFMPATYAAKLWEIGYADRTTAGFRLSDEPRQYGLENRVPADLTYVVGESVPARDWYFSQAKPGVWTIAFKTERPYRGDAVLTIGIAGQTHSPALQISVNGQPVGAYAGLNSSAGYRSAVLGSSHYEKKIIRFPSALLHVGSNEVKLVLSTGSVMYDVLKLEIDEPSTE